MFLGCFTRPAGQWGAPSETTAKPGVTNVDFSHLTAHFSKDWSQNNPLPSWSRGLGGPTSAEGLGALPKCVGVQACLRCPRLHTRRFGGGTETFSPLTCALQKRLLAVLSVPSPVSASQALLHLPQSHSSGDQRCFHVVFVLSASGSHILESSSLQCSRD